MSGKGTGAQRQGRGRVSVPGVATAANAAPAGNVPRVQLQMIIAGLTDGVILVEPDQTLAWANDAALAMHGVSDIRELGRDVTEYRHNFQLNYRNKHVVDLGSYPIDRVVAGEAFDDVVVEVTRRGSDHPGWVHQIRSLVINDAEGKPDCLVLVIKDATDLFQAEERFQRTFAANPAPAIICRLSDLRIVKVNQGFLDMTGYAREQVLGRTSYEVDLLANAERRNLAIERLSLGQTIPQMTAELVTPTGAPRPVIVAGQPIEVGSDACMLFTYADLSRQKDAEVALRQSEERFEIAFRCSPVPTALLRIDGFTLTAVNDAFVAIFSGDKAVIIGQSLDNTELWQSPAHLDAFKAAMAAADRTVTREEHLRVASGGAVDCIVTAVPLTIVNDKCLLCTIVDITDRKRTERDLTAAIDKVMADTSWFSRSLIGKLAEMRGSQRPAATEADARVDMLTKRERQVLQLICSGDSDATIAGTLKVSQHTIRNHVAALYRKLEVHNRTEAAVWGHARGFAQER